MISLILMIYIFILGVFLNLKHELNLTWQQLLKGDGMGSGEGMIKRYNLNEYHLECSGRCCNCLEVESTSILDLEAYLP